MVSYAEICDAWKKSMSLDNSTHRLKSLSARHRFLGTDCFTAKKSNFLEKKFGLTKLPRIRFLILTHEETPKRLKR